MAMSATHLTILPDIVRDAVAPSSADPQRRHQTSAETARANRRDRSLRPSESVPPPHPGERYLLEAAAMVASPILF